MLFLNRFCNDFRKFLREVGVFEEGNENVLEATRAGERSTPPFSIMLSSKIPSISIDLFIFCSSFCKKKSRVFFPDFVWFCAISAIFRIIFCFHVCWANWRTQTILRAWSDLKEEVRAMCALGFVLERKGTRWSKIMNFYMCKEGAAGPGGSGGPPPAIFLNNKLHFCWSVMLQKYRMFLFWGTFFY